jgi:hypothetical protein
LKAPVDIESLVKKARRVLRKASTVDDLQKSSTVAVAPVDDIKGESISLLLKSGSTDYARKLKNAPSKAKHFRP